MQLYSVNVRVWKNLTFADSLWQRSDKDLFFDGKPVPGFLRTAPAVTTPEKLQSSVKDLRIEFANAGYRDIVFSYVIIEGQENIMKTRYLSEARGFLLRNQF